ncbi:MAG: LPS export ABC transporter permease LptG [Chromatiales bacterium]|nr:LPS export ABC transporter permease LptG [Gammaproteobacteria bacterium]MCP5351710.1 LPS export ABC transporter permease LptG [Chromatiales bacterium]
MRLPLTIVDRYIGAAVLSGTLLVLLVLVGLNLFFAFVGEVNDIGKGNYGLSEAIQYTLLTIPRRTYEVFSIAALLGSLFGLGQLANHSELIVMRAAGISLFRIIRAALQAGLVLVILASFLGEVVAPPLEKRAQNLRSLAQSERITFQGSQGFWARDGLSFISIREILPGNRIQDIRIFEFDADRRLRSSTYAKTATYRDDRWLLNDIRKSEIDETGVVTREFRQAEWASLLSADLLSVVIVKPDILAVWDLASFISYQQDNGLESAPYELAFWSKVTLPLSSLVMVLLSIPFVFGSLRDSGASQRMFVGILIGIAFYLINKTLNHLSLVYGIDPLLSATLPSFAFLAIGLGAISRIR